MLIISNVSTARLFYITLMVTALTLLIHTATKMQQQNTLSTLQSHTLNTKSCNKTGH